MFSNDIKIIKVTTMKDGSEQVPVYI